MLWYNNILNLTFVTEHQYMERILVEGHRDKRMQDTGLTNEAAV
jgi:hypothetical protein